MTQKQPNAAAGTGEFPGAVAASGAAAGLGLVTRPEAADDVPFLTRLYMSLRWEEMAAVDWPVEAKVAFLQQQFDYQRRHYQTYYAAGVFLVITREGQDIGRLYLHHSPSDIRIVDIGFLPECRNRGFGTAMLQDLLAEGEKTGRTVSIHVETFNPAKRLYERLGFVKAGEEGPYHLMIRTPPGLADNQVKTA